MTMAARTLESCLELLIPTPEEFSIPEVDAAGAGGGGTSSSGGLPGTMAEDHDDSDDDDVDDGAARRRETGIIDPAAHAVTVTLKPGDF